MLGVSGPCGGLSATTRYSFGVPVDLKILSFTVDSVSLPEAMLHDVSRPSVGAAYTGGPPVPS